MRIEPCSTTWSKGLRNRGVPCGLCSLAGRDERRLPVVSRLADSGCGSHCMVRAVAPTSTIGNSTPYWGLPLEHHRDQHLPSAPRSGLAPSTAAGSKRSSAEPSSCAIAGRIRANVRFRRIGGDSDWRRLPQLWAKRRSWCGQSWRNSPPVYAPTLGRAVAGTQLAYDHGY